MKTNMHICNAPRAHQRVIPAGELGAEFEQAERLGLLIRTGAEGGGFLADSDGFPVVYAKTRTERWRTALMSRDTDVLMQIGRDHDCFVRAELTRNENASDSVLQALLGDPHPGIAGRAQWALRDRIVHPAHAVRA